MLINEKDIVYFRTINMDALGKVAYYKNDLIRIIEPDKVDYVLNLFSSGLLKELIDKKLFVETEITDYHIKNNDLILRHKKIGTVTYEDEWTFSMKKDAAILVLEIIEIIKPYGYDLFDPHQRNILFDHGKPVYVDLGSIHKTENLDMPISSDILEANYLYPLQLYKKGYCEVSKSLSRTFNYFEAKNEMYKFLHPYCPYWLVKVLDEIKLNYRKVVLLYYRKMNNELMNSDYVGIKKYVLKLYIILKYCVPIEKKEYRKTISYINRIKKKICKISDSPIKGIWSDYQDEMDVHNERFDILVNAILSNCTNINSAIEIAGNAGKFALTFMDSINVERYILTDYDEGALDKAYNTSKNFVIARYDFTHRTLIGTFEFPEKRFQSDICIALALCHHLLISQGMQLEAVVERMAELTNKYLLVEFMPLGLWSGEKDMTKRAPAWYTEEWFISGFEKKFVLLWRSQVEVNRIAFLFSLL